MLKFDKNSAAVTMDKMLDLGIDIQGDPLLAFVASIHGITTYSKNKLSRVAGKGFSNGSGLYSNTMLCKQFKGDDPCKGYGNGYGCGFGRDGGIAYGLGYSSGDGSLDPTLSFKKGVGYDLMDGDGFGSGGPGIQDADF